MHSYRTKLLAYTLTLLVLMVGALWFTYQYVYDLLDTEGDHHVAAMADLLQGQLEAERAGYLHNASMVARHPRVGEYLFAVVDIGTDPEPLEILYERQFSWIPGDRFLILSRDNRVLVNRNADGLAVAIHNARRRKEQGSFFLFNGRGLQLVAYAPVYYQQHYLGTVAFCRTLDRRWLAEQPHGRSGALFVVQQDRILESSLTSVIGQPFPVTGHNRLTLGERRFRLAALRLAPSLGDLPQLWFGLDETVLLERLNAHRRTIFLVAGISAIVVLIFGLLIIRHFTRPLTELSNITREVAAGRLPDLPRSHRRDEIAQLANHFADMLQALRRKDEEVNRVRDELQKTAITDSLTGLYNRRQLGEVFPKLLAEARRSGHGLWGVLIDLDKFKPINDTHGHICGDVVLEHFAARLREHSRANDYLFRMGGEEFLVLTVAREREGVLALAEKLRATMATLRVTCNDSTIGFTISCGVSQARIELDDTASLRDMLTRADAALYRAKQSGRNQVQVDDETPAVAGSAS